MREVEYPMAVIKCKICGGDLILTEGISVAVCAYCGTQQTVPTADNEKKLTLFARANRLRLACEFDKAAGVYESIVAEFPEEAEAYWGLVLCRYGIEYVDDPTTGKKIPTCHRPSFESILEDTDFEQACESSNIIARRIYRNEAKTIEDIRLGILEVSGNEEPYDIFICYKEKDENGERTIDSVIAQDVYDILVEKGYRVFFSRVSLEDKLGTEYEPYIFAALNSAKIMLVFGTDYEYFNAVWVKNEWSRFLALIAAGQKKTLIPCFKGVDAYDMPKDFRHLQAQDMGKVGAIQDLLRGIDKIAGKNMNAPILSVPAAQNALTERGMIFLEDGEWAKANGYFERALDTNPRDGKAYFGKVLATVHASSLNELKEKILKIDTFKDFDRAMQFSDGDQLRELQEINELMRKKWQIKCLTVGIKYLIQKKQQLEEAYSTACGNMLSASSLIEYQKAADIFSALGDYKDSATKQAECRRLMDEAIVKVRKAQHLIAAGYLHTVGLKSDNTVVTAGNGADDRNIDDWTDIVAVACREECTVGLKSDGTVVTAGSNTVKVNNWMDIVAVAAGAWHTVGLKMDGAVVAKGHNEYGQCDVESWTDIIAVDCGNYHTVGIKLDGSVMATGSNEDGQCNVGSWAHIITVACGNYHTIGLNVDGTVVVAGINANIMGSWTDIIAVACGYDHTVGLKSNGTVVAEGNNEYGQCDVEGWTDIVAVACGNFHTIGLKSDGTMVATGCNEHNQCAIQNWKLFKNFYSLEQERNDIHHQYMGIQEIEFRCEQEKRTQCCLSLESERATLRAELSTLKGLFSGGKRKQIETRLMKIEGELRKLRGEVDCCGSHQV